MFIRTALPDERQIRRYFCPVSAAWLAEGSYEAGLRFTDWRVVKDRMVMTDMSEGFLNPNSARCPGRAR